MVEYRITGRFRKDEKRHVVDRGITKRWTKEYAEMCLDQLQRQSEREIQHKKRKAVACGMVAVETEYCSDYDLLELRIEAREVTPWQEV